MKLVKIILAVLALCRFVGAQATHQMPPAAPCTQPATTQPVFKIHPPAGYVIENVDAKCNPPGTTQVGAGANGSVNLTIRYCRLDGFIFPIMLQGGNPGLHVHHNVIDNATPLPGMWTAQGSGDSSGIYGEGLDASSEIDHNIITDTGWWPPYDFTNPTARGDSARHHGIYRNEAGNATDGPRCHHNIILNTCGSQIGWRLGGCLDSNIFESGFDWDIVAGGLGSLPPTSPFGKQLEIFGNLTFGPRLDALPYYGGGFKIDPAMRRPGCVAINAGNMGSGNAAITNNPLAVDAFGNVIQQMGYWAKPGGVIAPAGAKVWTLADYYGRPDFYQLMKPDDAEKILAWYARKVSTPVALPAPAPLVVTDIVPATQPFDVTLHVDPMAGKVTAK